MVSSRRKSSGLSDLIYKLVQVALIALLVRTFAYEPFKIPSKSMVPTLQVGDFLVVSKFSYGYSRHSFPLSLHLFDGRIFFRAPERGDVVVFKVPSDNRTDYVKRLIGLPGDHIRVQHRVLYINGVPAKRDAAEDYTDRDLSVGSIRHLQFIETLPNGHPHIIIEDVGPESPADNTEEYVVPPHHYFMMGDNRDNSEDSRFLNAVGYVPEENLVGRAEFIFMSTTRWSRFFTRIL